MNGIEKLICGWHLTEDDFMEILSEKDNPQTAVFLAKKAVQARKTFYGTKVFIRGLIEFTNYCKITVITAGSAAETKTQSATG